MSRSCLKAAEHQPLFESKPHPPGPPALGEQHSLVMQRIVAGAGCKTCKRVRVCFGPDGSFALQSAYPVHGPSDVFRASRSDPRSVAIEAQDLVATPLLPRCAAAIASLQCLLGRRLRGCVRPRCRYLLHRSRRLCCLCRRRSLHRLARRRGASHECCW